MLKRKQTEKLSCFFYFLLWNSWFFRKDCGNSMQQVWTIPHGDSITIVSSVPVLLRSPSLLILIWPKLMMRLPQSSFGRGWWCRLKRLSFLVESVFLDLTLSPGICAASGWKSTLSKVWLWIILFSWGGILVLWPGNEMKIVSGNDILDNPCILYDRLRKQEQNSPVLTWVFHQQLLRPFHGWVGCMPLW